MASPRSPLLNFPKPSLFKRKPVEELTVVSWEQASSRETRLFTKAGAWESQIRLHGKAMFIGRFRNEMLAARARDIMCMWVIANDNTKKKPVRWLELNFPDVVYTVSRETIQGAQLETLLRNLRDEERNMKEFCENIGD